MSISTLVTGYFNPRPRKEGDAIFCTYRIIIFDISIHALVKRATFCAKCKYIDVTYFNPRPRKEGDFCQNMAIQQAIDFNPRPRKEGDYGGNKVTVGVRGFQSTPS